MRVTGRLTLGRATKAESYRMTLGELQQPRRGVLKSLRQALGAMYTVLVCERCHAP